MRKSFSVFFFCIAALANLYGQAGVFSKDDTSPNAPWQVLMTGATNPNLQLILGVNTSTSPFGGIQAFKQNAGPLPLVFQNAGGNVGIGTPSPISRLEVSGGTTIDGNILLNSANPTLSFNSGGASISEPAGNILVFTTSGLGRVWLDNIGNVGIGTSTPTQKLSVNGTIRAKEVIVDTNWSDYVFAKDYPLESLLDLEKSITESGHLPGIPSAQEVGKKGISLGDMQSNYWRKSRR